MRGKTVLAALSVLLALALVMSGLLAWMLGTAEGARQFFGIVSRFTHLEIYAENIRGRLWDELHIERVIIQWDQGWASTESFSISWRPLYLLTGKAVIEKVALRGLQIIDGGPEKTPELAWPEVTGLPAWLDGSIDSLQVSGLMYQGREKEPVMLNGVSSVVHWHNSRLTLKNALIDAVRFDASGTITAGFDRPLLSLNLLIIPERPVRAMDGFSIKADLYPGEPPEQIKGHASITGLAGTDERIGITADIGLVRQSVIIENMLVREAGRRGSLSVDGEMDFRAGTMGFRASLRLSQLDLYPELDMPIAIDGVVSFVGSTDAYKGDFRFSSAGESWRSAKLSGSFHGDKRGIRFLLEEGDWLRGSMKGTMGLSWEEGLSVAAEMKARGLDPAALTPEWHGRFNLDISGKMAWPEEGPPEAELNAKVLDSALRGRALAGEVNAGLHGDELAVRRLFFHGRGFDISANGKLSERLSFRADISDLSGLVPGSKGEAYLSGWVSAKDRFKGRGAARVRGLAVGDVTVGSADMHADLFTQQKRRLKLEADMKGVGYRKISINAVRLGISGSTASHDITASVNFNKASINARMTGEYKDEEKGWDGKIIRLSGQDRVGAWGLEGESMVYLSHEKFLLPRLALTGGNGERIAIQADVTIDPLKGAVHVDWSDFNLSRAGLWLHGVDLSGGTSGALHAAWEGGKLTWIDAKAKAAGKFTADRHAVGIRESFLSCRWDSKGLIASVTAKLSDNGVFEARMTSPEPAASAIPTQGIVDGIWQNVDLALLRPFLPERISASGHVSGRVHLGWAGGKLQKVSGVADASGTLVLDKQRVEAERAHLRADWNSEALHADAELELSREQGALKGEIRAAGPPRVGLPDSGKFVLRLDRFDASAVSPWLPEGLDLKGKISSKINGSFLPQRRFDLSGNAALSGGSVRYEAEKSDFRAQLRAADISFTWRDETIKGGFEVAFADYGKLHGEFSLPVDARLPVQARDGGQLSVSLRGKVEEKGLLTSFFPGLIQESGGRVEVVLGVRGTWARPSYGGRMELAGAGAYLPTAGVRITDVRATARFDKDKVYIENFYAKSGKGSITGGAEMTLRRLRIKEYRGNITGKDFQVVYLPELQVAVSPELSFAGNGDSVSVRGELKVTELLVSRGETEIVRASKDMIIIDEPEKPARYLPGLDIVLTITLGEQSRVRMEGVDARIEGQVMVSATGPDAISGNGVIRVAKGAYRRYGIDLVIQRGNVIWAGGPIDNPILDFMATRDIGDVKAGVLVSGTARTPVVKLYSVPSMPDTDVLAYIVLGHPAGADRAEIGLLTRAAGVLLSGTELATLQTKLKQEHGLDVIAIETGGGDVAQSTLTIGKYLSPRLYISYGLSLFGDEDILRLKYELSKSLEIQTESGSKTGADIYYKIEFR